MALKKDITDSKGVKARYHRIRSFNYEDGKLTIVLVSYVNQTTRDAEKTTLDGNVLATNYDADTEQLRKQLQPLIDAVQSGDEDKRDELKELSNQINEREFSQDRPTHSPVVDTAYSIDEVVLDYFEPLSLEGIYTKLTEGERYAGAETI